MPARVIAAVVIFGVLGLQATVWGQGTSSSSGMFGQRSLGGGLSAGTRTLGGSSLSGGTGIGTSGGIGQNMPTDVGQVDASDRFVRSNRRPGEFVGASAQDVVQNFIGAVQAGAAAQGTGPAARSANRSAGANQPGRGGRQGQTEIRSSLHVAFGYSKPGAPWVNKELSERLVRLCRMESPAEVEVLIDQETAILRGVVATGRDRALAERVIHLEPGIWRVNNELVVAAVPAVLPPGRPDRPAAAKEGPAGAEKPVADSPAETLVLPELPPVPPAGEPAKAN